MKTVILGSGAMGSLYGGMLAEAGFDVTLVDVWKEHIDAVNASGLSIEGIGGDRVIRSIRGTTDPAQAGKADLVIVFVKATATAQAMKGAMALLGPETVVLTLQNGLGNVEKLNETAGAERVMAGITGHGCTLLGPGKIRHAGQGNKIPGEPRGRAAVRRRDGARHGAARFEGARERDRRRHAQCRAARRGLAAAGHADGLLLHAGARHQRRRHGHRHRKRAAAAAAGARAHPRHGRQIISQKIPAGY